MDLVKAKDLIVVVVVVIILGHLVVVEIGDKNIYMKQKTKDIIILILGICSVTFLIGLWMWIIGVY